MANENILNSYINNNYDKAGTDNLTKFFGYNQNVYLDPATTGFGFIFITRPSLFIYPQKPPTNEVNKTLAYNNMCIDPEFTMFITGENKNKKDQEIIKQLSYFEFQETQSLFMPIFTNLIKSFNPLDTTLDTTQAFQTRKGYNMVLPTNMVPSIASNQLNFSITETDNYDITKIISLIVKYIDRISDGTFTANPDMIKQNMIDYMSSIYYFLVGPDGQTLKYWCRFTGCYPTNIPYSAFDYQRGSSENEQIDLSFQYTLKEDMNPKILEDFNALSLHLVSSELFSDINYDNFLNETDNSSDGSYVSYINSPLLNKSLLENGSRSVLVNSPSRDPLIMWVEGKESDSVSGETQSKYILSFGNNTIINDFANTTIDDDSAFNYESLQEN